VLLAGLFLGLFVGTTSADSSSKTPEQLFQEAIAAHQRGDDDTAIRDYREILKVQPNSMETHANLGVLLAGKKQFGEAIREYEIALKLAPDNQAMKLNLALAYYKQGQWKAAADLLEQLHRSQPPDVRVAVLLADCDVHLNDGTQAIDVLSPVEAAAPDNLDVEQAMGTALLMTGKLQEALQRLHKVADGKHSAPAYLQAGKTALQLNQFEVAKRDAESAEAIDPNLPGIETLKGQALQYVLDNAGAIAALRKAVQQNQSDFDAQVTLGALLNEERENAEAQDHLKRAVELKPDSTLAHYELARAEQATGDLNATLRELQWVTRTEPGWLPPHVMLAAVYGRLQRPEDATREREIVDRLRAEDQKKENSGLALPSQ
jgi:tetratricopeptide (TPR) repeat protein